MSRHRNADFLLDFGYALMVGDAEWHEEEWLINKNDRIMKNYKMWHRRPRIPSCCVDLEKQLTPEEVLIMKEEDEEFREMMEEEDLFKVEEENPEACLDDEDNQDVADIVFSDYDEFLEDWQGWCEYEHALLNDVEEPINFEDDGPEEVVCCRKRETCRVAKTKFDHRFSRRRRFVEVKNPKTGEVKLELVWHKGKRPEKKPRYKTVRFPTKRKMVMSMIRREL